MQKSFLFSLITCLSMPALAQVPVPLREAITTASPLEEHFEPLKAEELLGSAYLSKDGRSIVISVDNRGTRALNVDGDNASALSAKGKAAALMKNQIISPPSKVQVPGDILYVGASVGSLGAIPVTFDVVHKAQSPEGLYYGKDEKRRAVTARRFGRRVVFPQEVSQGTVYLDRALRLPAQVSIPVSIYPDEKNLGRIVIDVTVSQPDSQRK